MMWPQRRIEDVFDVARGGSPRPIQSYLTESPDGLNWIMIGDTVDGSKYIEATRNRIKPEGLSKTRMVHEGDFLLKNSMSFGRPYILKTAGCIHDGWLVLSPKRDDVYPVFFYYLLGSESLCREFSKRAAGAVVKNLNTAIVRQVAVPLPPLAEQKRIAAILDAADALRAKRRESLAQLDTLLQSTFLDLFGDPVTNPKGWPGLRLEEVTTKITDGTHKTPHYTESGIEFLSAKDLIDGEVRWGTGKSISHEEHEQLTRRCNPEIGDLLLAKSGSLGSVSVIDRDHEFSLFESLCLIKQDRSRINASFLATMIRTPSMQKHLLRKNKGVAVKRLHLVDIRGLGVLVPSMDDQHHFATIVESIERQKTRLPAHLAELDTLFASLQSRAFNGEL